MKNLKVRVPAFLTAGTILFTMSGCGKKGAILEDTLLEKTFVATVDDDIAILKPQSSGESLCSVVEINAHYHYFDVISGQWITDAEECVNKYVTEVGNIEKIGSIDSCLTEEEMLKAQNDELTDEDVVSILYRIKEKEEEKTKIK